MGPQGWRPQARSQGLLELAGWQQLCPTPEPPRGTDGAVRAQARCWPGRVGGAPSRRCSCGVPGDSRARRPARLPALPGKQSPDESKQPCPGPEGSRWHGVCTRVLPREKGGEVGGKRGGLGALQPPPTCRRLRCLPASTALVCVILPKSRAGTSEHSQAGRRNDFERRWLEKYLYFRGPPTPPCIRSPWGLVRTGC